MNDILDISLIIPVYNNQLFLQECLNSAISQTNVNMEIIIVDDCSTDGSISIIRDFEKKDTRIKFIPCQEKIGVALARNRAMDLAQGEYIAFLDADDFYPHCNVLSTLLHTAKQFNVVICGGSLYKFDYQKQKMITYVKDQHFLENQYMKYENYQHDGGFYRFIYNRDFLNKHKLRFKNLSRYQDAEFFVRTMVTAQLFYVIKDCTYIYRVNHKKVLWNHQRLKDHLTGVLSVLTISKQHNYRILHYKLAKNVLDMLKYKLRYRYCEKIRLLPLIVQAVRSIDFGVLRDDEFSVRLYPSKYLRAFLFN